MTGKRIELGTGERVLWIMIERVGGMDHSPTLLVLQSGSGRRPTAGIYRNIG